MVAGTEPYGRAAAVALNLELSHGRHGASARIEIYLGFPTGVSGMALMARAYNQAQKFGADLAIPEEVVTVESAPDKAHGRFRLTTGGGELASARSVVIASGALYRRLEVDNLA